MYDFSKEMRPQKMSNFMKRIFYIDNFINTIHKNEDEQMINKTYS